MFFGSLQEKFEEGFYVLFEGFPYFMYSNPEFNIDLDIEIVTPDEFLLFFSLASPIEIGVFLGEYDEEIWEKLSPVRIN
jgi:hypothetical protein